MDKQAQQAIIKWIFDNHQHHEGSDRTEMNLSDGYVVTHKDEYLCQDGDEPYVNSLELEKFILSLGVKP